MVPPGCAADSIVLSFPVPAERAGQRLDRFIQACIPRLSRTRAQAIVAACAHFADGRRRRSSDRVRCGETVLLVRERFEEPAAPSDFQILYSDDWVMAIDKPAGLTVHPTATYHRHTLSYMLRQRYGEAAPRLAHRLDRETSGVLLCGMTAEAERLLQSAFENRRVRKLYWALVRGELAECRGEIDLPLAPALAGPHVMMQVQRDGSGAPASTTFRVHRRVRGYTWLELEPHTGRQHQLRVHLAAIGHPIVGDKLYGPQGPTPFHREIAEGMSEPLLQQLGHPRQALHAHAISLVHPRGDQRLHVRADLPDDLRQLWRSWGGED